jgi:ppGpp synthetase/RelA/SpoT-type nucleotidyltranferase
MPSTNYKTRYEAVARQYEKTYRRKYADAAESVRKTLVEALYKNGIKHASSARAKDAKSLARKLSHRSSKGPLALKSILPLVGKGPDAERIKDLAGVRISLYFPSDWAHAEAKIFDCFANVTCKVHPENPKGRPRRKRFEGYAARHYYVDTPMGIRVEIQVASALTHAWMEVEHDLVYKQGRKALDATELAILDGLNGIVTSGEVILDGLKVRLLRRGVVEIPGRGELNTVNVAMKVSKKNLIVIGQNLFSLLVAPETNRTDRARQFKQQLLRRLVRNRDYRATIIIADPHNVEQMKHLSYGFRQYSQHLDQSVAALKELQKQAKRAGVDSRLTVGASTNVDERFTVLADPERISGVAYVKHTQSGTRSKDRPIVRIGKRKHPVHFEELFSNYAGACLSTLIPFS